MKKLLAVMCMVVSFSSFADLSEEEVEVAVSLGKCAAAELHITDNSERFNESYKLAIATMGKRQFGVYSYGTGLIDGIAMTGENHLIVRIYNDCKARYGM